MVGRVSPGSRLADRIGKIDQMSIAAESPLLAGHPFPLGAHPEGGGVRFAVASSSAEAV